MYIIKDNIEIDKKC